MSVLASVDLPEPLGPIRAWISPREMSRSTPLRISRSSMRTCRSLISRSAMFSVSSSSCEGCVWVSIQVARQHRRIRQRRREDEVGERRFFAACARSRSGLSSTAASSGTRARGRTRASRRSSRRALARCTRSARSSPRAPRRPRPSRCREQSARACSRHASRAASRRDRPCAAARRGARDRPAAGRRARRSPRAESGPRRLDEPARPSRERRTRPWLRTSSRQYLPAR